MFDYVAEYADFKGDENVYDLYTSLGSIALYIAYKVARVTGIEEIPEAIADANEAVDLMGLRMQGFMPEMSKTYSTIDFIEEAWKTGCSDLDPPCRHVGKSH